MSSVVFVAMALVLGLTVGGVQASPLILDNEAITNAAFNARWSTTPTDSIIGSPWSLGSISGTITSVVYPGLASTAADGLFAYTYQITITGQTGATSAKGFTVPFFSNLTGGLVTTLDLGGDAGADSSAYVSNARVAGDVLADEYGTGGPGITPQFAGFVTLGAIQDDTSGDVTWNFVNASGNALLTAIGDTSAIVVIVSPFPPTTGTTNVIDSGSETFAQVLTPRISQPSSLLLLGTGLVGLALWGRRRRDRSGLGRGGTRARSDVPSKFILRWEKTHEMQVRRI